MESITLTNVSVTELLVKHKCSLNWFSNHFYHCFFWVWQQGLSICFCRAEGIQVLYKSVSLIHAYMYSYISMRINKMKSGRSSVRYANVFNSPSVRIQGLTSGEKNHCQIPHSFLWRIYAARSNKQGGKKSHLQFSLPLGNNTWRTHLPWLIFLGIGDLCSLNPIWTTSFFSFFFL